uniref:Uncharacterized protein n=1 Tax=Anguilla anguilla TaxID=7936 RepID=A0A0E9WZC7_ANGAN
MHAALLSFSPHNKSRKWNLLGVLSYLDYFYFFFTTIKCICSGSRRFDPLHILD